MCTWLYFIMSVNVLAPCVSTYLDLGLSCVTWMIKANKNTVKHVMQALVLCATNAESWFVGSVEHQKVIEGFSLCRIINFQKYINKNLVSLSKCISFGHGTIDKALSCNICSEILWLICSKVIKVSLIFIEWTNILEAFLLVAILKSCYVLVKYRQ